MLILSFAEIHHPYNPRENSLFLEKAMYAFHFFLGVRFGEVLIWLSVLLYWRFFLVGSFVLIEFSFFVYWEVISQKREEWGCAVRVKLMIVLHASLIKDRADCLYLFLWFKLRYSNQKNKMQTKLDLYSSPWLVRNLYKIYFHSKKDLRTKKNEAKQKVCHRLFSSRTSSRSLR